jgi:predicted ATP-grasp superfamily ATP-dependent carboligase
MKEFSVLILDGQSDIPLYAVRSLGEIENIVLHTISNSSKSLLQYSRHISSHRLLVAKNEDEYLTKILQRIRVTNANVLLPIMEPETRFVSKHRHILSKAISIAPIPQVDALDIFTDKWHAAQRLIQCDIPHPQTILYRGKESLEHDIQALGFPVLVKPRIGTNGSGIRVFADFSSLKEFLGVNNQYKDQYVIQNYIDGEMYGGTAVFQEGNLLAGTVYQWLQVNKNRFSFPKALQLIEDQELLNMISTWGTKTKWSGIANFDFISDRNSQKYVLLEVNPRLGSSSFGSVNAGVNFPYLLCLAGLGIEFKKPIYELKPFAYAKTALGLKVRNLFSDNKSDFSLKDTSIKYDLRDPLPDLHRLFRLLWS